MCAQSQNLEKINFEGTHYIMEDIFHISSEESGFWLESELVPYMTAWDQVRVQDDLIINEEGSSVPLLKVQNILIQNTLD